MQDEHNPIELPGREMIEQSLPNSLLAHIHMSHTLALALISIFKRYKENYNSVVGLTGRSAQRFSVT